MQELTDLEFIHLLRQRGIELRAKDDRLRITAPAGALTQSFQDELRRRKSALLLLLERDDAQSASGDERVRVAPLTYAQQGIWLVERFHPGTAAYSIPQAVWLDMPIEPATLQEAVNRLVARHEILRAHMGTAGDEPVEYIHPRVEVPVGFTDLFPLEATLEEGRREEKVRELVRQNAKLPFNLAQPPLVRFELFRLAPARHVLFVNVHHLLADQWSMGILHNELMELYTALSSGTEAQLPPLPMQYSQYAAWEREHLRAVEPAQLAYWKAKLADAPAQLELPFSKPRPAQQSFAGEVEPAIIDEGMADALRRLARQENASLYMVLLAAFSLLLYRYTGREDFAIGSPISSRTRVETESLIGLFINTMVIRCRPRPSWSFRMLVEHVRETALEAYANSDLPFQRLVKELHQQRDAGSSAIFQIMFVIESVAEGPAAAAAQIDTQPGIAKFDLTLQLTDSGRSIQGGFEYRTDLFDRAGMEQFARSFSVLLEEIVRDPDQSIAGIQLLSSQERQRILMDWNATALALPEPLLIHRLFEQRAAEMPQAIAVIHGDEQISYGELNRRANHLAHYLIELGVGAESCVGICLRRSIHMIEAMLAVLKAGGAYVPLDPAYPAQRLEAMMEDSRLRILVSQEALLGLLPGAGKRIVTLDGVLDGEAQALASAAEDNPDLPMQPDRLAYVIYTSGSTGRPKGVAIEHHSAVSLLHWGRQTFPRETLAFMLASTSICFDLSVFEIFLPLSLGHTVVVAEDVLELPRLPAARHVTFINTVPTAMRELIRMEGVPDSIQCVNLAGEPFPASLVEEVQRRWPAAKIFDSYGPTETTTYSTWTRRYAGQPATIGRPLANTRIYILDANLQPVPPGVPGELYIAGEGVARGYLHQPELTSERFPTLDHLPGAGRAYKTGDLAKYRSDGNIEFLGRIDHQVKIRGFRIELGEIESVLRRHPQVADAVVIVHQDPLLGPSLVAFVLPQPGASIDVAELLELERNSLPAHAVAGQILVRDHFPLTPNGKVDRRAMAASYERPKTEPAAEQAPRDELERALVEIWEQCFERSPIGVEEDFFSLGGHSLLALRLFSEIEKRLGKAAMLSVLFQAPTIRQLANVIRG